MKTVPVALIAALSFTTLTGAAAGTLFPTSSAANATIPTVDTCGLGVTATPTKSPEPKTAKVTLRIKGMVTDSCPVLVETAVGRIDGVVSVRANLAKKLAEVEYLPQKTSPEAIVQVIRDQTGFDAEVAR